MPVSDPIQLVREARIDDEVSNKNAVVTFANQEEEERYVELDTQLIESIKRVYESFGIREGDGIHHIEDWWRNRLRGVECDPVQFRVEILEQLQALLTAEWARWRIIIHYYRGMSGSADCGSALVPADGILATKGLKADLR